MKEFVNKQTMPQKKKKTIQPQETQEQVQARKKKGKPSRKQKTELRRKFKIDRLRESKEAIGQNLAAAQSSTKSVGRFDKKAHREEKEHKVKRRKQYSNFSTFEQELERNKQIFDVVRKSGFKKLQHSL